MNNKPVKRLTLLMVVVTHSTLAWTSQNQTNSMLDAIGTIFCDGLIRGTASHIQHDREDYSIVITAAHVLLDRKTRSAFRSCSYRASNARFQNFLISKISTPGKLLRGSDALEGMSKDWVFAMLNQKLHAPKLRLRRYSQESLPNTQKKLSLAMLVYDGKLGKIKSVENCRSMQSPHVEHPTLLLHNCAHGPGVSGAPLLNLQTLELIGVHGGQLIITHLPHFNIEGILGQARLIDDEVLDELKRFSMSLP
jgi:hypothetical protein|tara:strand:+ start:172685 stop:173437 length:753 start_codon:yes stop_codon:yes gene_type:complete